MCARQQNTKICVMTLENGAPNNKIGGNLCILPRNRVFLHRFRHVVCVLLQRNGIRDRGICSITLYFKCFYAKLGWFCCLELVLQVSWHSFCLFVSMRTSPFLRIGASFRVFLHTRGSNLLSRAFFSVKMSLWWPFSDSIPLQSRFWIVLCKLDVFMSWSFFKCDMCLDASISLHWCQHLEFVLWSHIM